jgi:hypothetical protein
MNLKKKETVRSFSAACQVKRPIDNQRSAIENGLGPPIGLEPTPNSFEANRSSIKLRGQEKNFGLRIANFGFERALDYESPD